VGPRFSLRMEVPRDQMSLLIDNGLFDSAELLGCFLMSSTTSNSDMAPSARAENMVLFGDALYGKKEYRRALNVYRQAYQHNKLIPKQSAIASKNALPTGNRTLLTSPVHSSPFNENEVKFKIGLCLIALHDIRTAITEMEAIPSKARTLRINLTMGKLYRMTSYKSAACISFKDCLRQCPYALEAIAALADMGVPLKEIQSLLPQAQSKSGRAPSDLEPVRWVQRYAEAQCAAASQDYKGVLEHFGCLSQRFPNNLHVMIETAKAEAAIGRIDEALLNFEKVRALDQYNITGMDEYAMLLHTRTDLSELNRLLNDLLTTDPNRPEVWVVSAIYWDKRDDKSRALTDAERSLRVDDRHIPGYIVKGNLLLSLNRAEAAVMAFRKAQQLRPDLRSYQGLVRGNLAISKPKEALLAAREALKALPHSAKALTLVGDVYANNPEARDKARKFYESALRMEPGYLGAALALADLRAAEGRNAEAIELLETYLKDWADDSLHTKLAQIYVATEKLDEALSHYSEALRINPNNEAAKKGLERLERQMKGGDPDLVEEEEENEEEDAEGDPEEAEY